MCNTRKLRVTRGALTDSRLPNILQYQQKDTKPQLIVINCVQPTVVVLMPLKGHGLRIEEGQEEENKRGIRVEDRHRFDQALAVNIQHYCLWYEFILLVPSKH